MKIRVIKDAYYNMEYIKGSERRIIDFKGDKLPSWAEAVKGGKKTEDKKGEEKKTLNDNETLKQVQGDNIQTDGNETEETAQGDSENKEQTEVKNTETEETTQGDNDNKAEVVLNEVEKQQYLELLLNEAVEKNILIDDMDKKTIDEQISALEITLGKEQK